MSARKVIDQLFEAYREAKEIRTPIPGGPVVKVVSTVEDSGHESRGGSYYDEFLDGKVTVSGGGIKKTFVLRNGTYDDVGKIEKYILRRVGLRGDDLDTVDSSDILSYITGGQTFKVIGVTVTRGPGIRYRDFDFIDS